jgi:hypothetical protein
MDDGRPEFHDRKDEEEEGGKGVTGAFPGALQRCLDTRITFRRLNAQIVGVGSAHSFNGRAAG